MDDIGDDGHRRYLEIRRLRKKLRQIENLYHLDRDWTDEEWAKIKKKDNFIAQLQTLLSDELEFDSPNESSETQNSSAELTESYSTKEDSTQGQVPSDTNVAQPAESTEPVLKKQRKDIEDDQESPTTSHTPGSPGSSSSEPAPVEAPQHSSTTKVKTTSMQKENLIPQASPANRSQAHESTSKKSKKNKPANDPDILPSVQVIDLQGHNQLISAAYTDGELLATGSRDTTVRVWKIRDGLEICCLGGHTNTVTCVRILPASALSTIALDETLTGGDAPPSRAVVSGSADCSIRLWDIDRGKLIREVYIFSPVVAVDWLQSTNLLVVATEAGKLMLYDLSRIDSHPVISEQCHEQPITALHCFDRFIWTGSEGGELALRELRTPSADGDKKDLSLRYSRETLSYKTGLEFPWRPVLGVFAVDDMIYAADTGVNVKQINWKRAQVERVTHHWCEVGRTSAVAGTCNKLAACGFDVDTSKHFINVFSVVDRQLHYLYTLDDDDTGAVLRLSAASHSPDVDIFVSAGTQLKIWTVRASQSSNTRQKKAVSCRSELRVTDIETDEDEATDTEDETEQPSFRNTSKSSSWHQEEEQHSNSSWWWCTLL